MNGPASFTEGVTFSAQFILMASVFLIEAMLAKRPFELRIMGCLTMLNEIDPHFVNDFGFQVQNALSPAEGHTQTERR